jgi:hypothetical protein
MSATIRVWEVLIIENNNQEEINNYFSKKRIPGSSRPVAIASRGFFIEGEKVFAASTQASALFYFLNPMYLYDSESNVSESDKEKFDQDIYEHNLHESDKSLFPYGYWEKLDNKKCHDFECELLTGDSEKDREVYNSEEFQEWIKDNIFEYLNGNHFV